MYNYKKLFHQLLSEKFLILDLHEKSNDTVQSDIRVQIFYRDESNHFFIKRDDSLFPCATLPLYSIWDDIIKASLSYSPILFEKDGEIIGYTTAEMLLKNLMVEHEHTHIFLDTILDTIDGSCTVIDSNENVLYWTKGAEKLFSLKASEILGNPICNFFSKKNLAILDALKNGTTLRQAQHQAREDVTVLINSNPVLYNQKIIGAVVSEVDITNQILLNKELSATSEKLFSLEKEVQKTQNTLDPFTYIKGHSTALKKTVQMVKKAATTNASILINGESGVGKELFAKAIHNLRENDKAPFIAINCGAIPSSLFESEIFGYEKGAFSGADHRGKKGKAELAKGGTLFLDEIGEMPLDMQVKILRLLQEKKFYPVGGTKEVEVDFHVVAATNRDLKELVKEGKFREDLYYRLNVVNIKIPPLRERSEDIIELSHYFLYEISVKYNRPIHGISQEIMQNLLQYNWPGNIRELKNVIERLVVFSDNGQLKIEDLPIDFEIQPIDRMKPLNTISSKNDDFPLNVQLQEYEKAILIKALKKANGNKNLCAKNLGVTRATLYNRINKLGIPDL